MATIDILDKTWIETVLRTDQDVRKLNKVLSIKCNAATNAGDNYTSVMLRANINGILGSGTPISTRVIVKKKLSTKEGHSNIFLTRAFQRESDVYKHVLGKYTQMTMGTPLANEDMWAKFYYGSREAIVMEDLRIKEYTLADRKAGLDLVHSLLVMEFLGRLHAFSIVAIERGIVNPTLLEEYGLLHDSLKEFFISSYTAFSNAMDKCWGPEWSDISKKVREFGTTGRPMLIKLSKEEPLLKVICHGDCWVNNQMFRYNEEGQPIHIKFVDFQISHYGSFAWDINYFLHSSVRLHIRDPHYRELLKSYRDSMEKTFIIFDLDKKAPTVEEVIEECHRLRSFKFVADSLITPVIMCDKEDVVELDDLIKSPEKSEKLYGNARYQDYMKPVLLKYIEDKTI